jgi:hypothetical protein
MIIVRLLSTLHGWFWHHQVYSGLGAGIVMESIALKTLPGGFWGKWDFSPTTAATG